MKKEEFNELIKKLSDKELLIQLYITQLLLIIVSIFLGFILFENTGEFLSLFDWKDQQVWKTGAAAGVTVVLIDILLMRVLPRSLYDDGGLNERIFRNQSIIQIALIAAVVSISEEILFRGVIQTHFGLVISSIIFALVHYRYLFNWFLFGNIIFLSFIIGFIYQQTGNLAVTIMMHFIIDFLLGIFISCKNKRETGRDD